MSFRFTIFGARAYAKAFNTAPPRNVPPPLIRDEAEEATKLGFSAGFSMAKDTARNAADARGENAPLYFITGFSSHRMPIAETAQALFAWRGHCAAD